MRKLLICLCFLLAFVITANAQILRPVHWSYGSKRLGKTKAVIFIKATIDESWHIYSVKLPDGGPVKTSFVFTPAKDYALSGEILEPEPVTKFEQAFNMNVRYFENAVTFRQDVILKSAHPIITGKLIYMVCNDQKCLPPEGVSFRIPIK
jgi:hypothetical protein